MRLHLPKQLHILSHVHENADCVIKRQCGKCQATMVTREPIDVHCGFPLSYPLMLCLGMMGEARGRVAAILNWVERKAAA